MLGRLLWAAPFVPGFKERVRPLEALLSPRSAGEWTEECTAALNDILRVVEKRFTLAIADPHAPLQLAVSVGPETGMAVMTQQQADGEVRVVALVSRALSEYEKKRPPLEQKLHLARWALHRCRRFTATSPAVHLHIPEPAHVLVLADRLHHIRLEALLVDLASYGVTYGPGDDLQ